MTLPLPLLLCLLFHYTTLAEANPGGEGEESGVSLGQFMEEVRGAMSSQWELLQNLRYHTLGIKVRLAQVETHLHTLASRLPTPGDEEGGGEGQPCQLGGGAGVEVLVEAVRDLTEAYTSLVNSSRCEADQANFEEDFAQLTGIVDEIKDSSMGTGLAESKGVPTTTTTTPTTTTTTTTTPTTITTTTISSTSDTTFTTGGEGGSDEEGTAAGPPHILLDDNSNVTARVDATITLTCRARNLQDQHAIAWIRSNDKTFLALGDTTITRDWRVSAAHDLVSGDYILSIMAVTREDAGPYDCQISTDPVVSHTFWLAIEGVVEDDAVGGEQDGARIIGSEANVTAQAGNSALLKCRIENYHEDTMLWYRGNELVARGLEVLTEDNRFISTRTASFNWWLDIIDLRPTDSGRYRCELPTGDPLHHTFWLSVLGNPSFPTITSKETEVTAVRGERVTLTCSVQNIGNQTVSWIRLKDYNILSISRYKYTIDSRVFILKLGEDWNLQIADVRSTDSGEYKCQVSTTPPTSLTFSLQVEKPRRDLGEARGILSVTTGHSATFTCTIPHLDVNPVLWRKLHNKRVLAVGNMLVTTPAHRFSVTNNGDHWQLTLNNVRREDAGDYQCLVATEVPITQNFTLHIHGPELNLAPEDVMAVVGKEATLTCYATGQPRPVVTWTKDDLPLPFDRMQDTSVGELIIRSVREGDAGRYVCRASNQHGTAEGEVVLWVLQATRIVRPPRDRQRTPGQTAVFRCKAVADSELKLRVSWLKDGEHIDFSESTRYGQRPNNALVVNSAQEEDSGVYTCLASTHLDTAAANATLTVQVRQKEERGDVSIFPASLDYCPPPFERLRTRLCVLQVTDRKLSWSDADQHCRVEGGTLAWAAGEEDVFQIFLHDRYGLGSNTWTHWPFWVGGKEEEVGVGEKRGEWWWVDGVRVDPEVWATGHPRTYGTQTAPEGSCMVLDGYQDYQAASLPCHYRRFFLCRL